LGDPSGGSVSILLVIAVWLLFLLSACAGRAPTIEQYAAMPPDTVVGYTCPSPGAVRVAELRQKQGLPLTAEMQKALSGECELVTAAEHLERERHLASCHIIGGCSVEP